jgi:thiosulfate/3-mercaptopyruvate sulfurtransferase
MFMQYTIDVSRAYRMWEQDVATFIDCRFVLGQPEAGDYAYREGHIPRAAYLDLERNGSNAKRVDGTGGRHPLPDMNRLAAKLTALGINAERKVIVYDEQGGAMAARLWWLMTYMGHDHVFLLDGGWPAWLQAGYPVTSGNEEETLCAGAAPPFMPRVRHEMLVDAAYIEERQSLITSGEVVLLDSREAARYEGTKEPIDPVAGHIPGAGNYFWKANLDDQGYFRPLHERRQRFAQLTEAREIIVYCGSGVTACPNVLSLLEAGLKHVKLYAGSWSDWISDSKRPIATGSSTSHRTL